MTTGPFITANENDMALQVFVRHHHKTQFSTEQLKTLKQLNVQQDKNGMLRCHGRFGKEEWLRHQKSHACRF